MLYTLSNFFFKGDAPFPFWSCMKALIGELRLESPKHESRCQGDLVPPKILFPKMPNHQAKRYPVYQITKDIGKVDSEMVALCNGCMGCMYIAQASKDIHLHHASKLDNMCCCT